MSAATSITKRLVRILGPDSRAVVQSAVALLISIVATLVAGLTLASAEERLAELPGLLLMVPAAIAQRGNVFGALGSRLGTAIHTGEFSLTRRIDTIFGQNVLASLSLSAVAAIWLAIVGWALAGLFGVTGAMSLVDFVAVSFVGGMLASVLVLAITVALAAGSTRYGWDLDNVTAPLVTGTGDLVTLPALIVGSFLVGPSNASAIVAVLAVVSALTALTMSVRSSLALVRRVVLESLPVLGLASTLSLIAGIVVERRLAAFLDEPALLILIPAYFGMAGALGGILSSRLGTKVHLGLIEPQRVPQRQAWLDIRSVGLLAIPIFVLVGGAAHVGSLLISVDSPGLLSMLLVAALAGLGATVVVLAVAYYGTLLAVRFGLDPDTASIPLTNSVLDLVGAFTLVGAVIALGLTG